jgi:hypothetical protein
VVAAVHGVAIVLEEVAVATAEVAETAGEATGIRWRPGAYQQRCPLRVLI